MSGDNTTLSASNLDNDILSAQDAGTRAALSSKINNAAPGSTITLENDYLFTTGSTTSQISINKDLTIGYHGEDENFENVLSELSIA